MTTILANSANRDEWLAARRTGVTATDVSRLARGGAGTWQAIRAEKAGTARDFQNAAMRHGNERESVIAEFASTVFGLASCGDLFAADDEPRFLATPDTISSTLVGEIKTTVHDWESWADVPGGYVDQMLWQMRVTGRRAGKLIFEPHENGIPLYPFPKVFDLAYDAERVAVLEATALEFLTSMSGEPDPDAAELDALLREFIDLDEVASAAVARRDEAKARIEAHLGGEPRKFEGSAANLTRSADGVSRRFDSPGFKKSNPDLYKQFEIEVPVKGRLTITRRSDA